MEVWLQFNSNIHTYKYVDIKNETFHKHFVILENFALEHIF